MSEKDADTWNRAVDTLASMCIADKMGTGPTKEAFIQTLRLYASEMEKLLVYVKEEAHDSVARLTFLVENPPKS